MRKTTPIFIIIILFLILSGCATIGNKEYLETNSLKEQNLMSTETEKKFAYYVDATIQNKYMILENSELQNKIEPIFNNIVKYSDRKDINFILKIVNSNEVNAFAGPAGYIYIT